MRYCFVSRFDLLLCLCVFVVCLVILDVDSCMVGFVFQAEDGIRDLVRSRGLGDVYKRQDFDSLKNHFKEYESSIKNISKDSALVLFNQWYLYLSLIHI